MASQFTGTVISFLSFVGGVLLIPYIAKLITPLTPYFANVYILYGVTYLLAFLITMYGLPRLFAEIYVKAKGGSQ